MNKFGNFIKSELSGWKKKEVIALVIIIFMVVFNKLILQDSIIAVISAVCGVLYTIIAGKGKLSCYIFGLMGSSFYGYLAFSNSLWGNLILYVGYYIPMQILGIFNWKKNLNPKNREIYKTELKGFEKVLLLSITVTVCLISYFILKHFDDSQPLYDSTTTVLSLVGMYLTVKRCIEQWIVWSIVNLLCVIMWINIVLTGSRAYSTVLMWLSYLVMGVYFYFQWKKELKENVK